MLVLLHLANLIEFSTAKDGLMRGEEGFYVYSQSGLGDPSKVCSSIRKGKDQKMNRRKKDFIIYFICKGSH